MKTETARGAGTDGAKPPWLERAKQPTPQPVPAPLAPDLEIPEEIAKLTDEELVDWAQKPHKLPRGFRFSPAAAPG